MGLPYEKVGDACHLTYGCEITDFGLTYGVQDGTPLFLAVKVSRRVALKDVIKKMQLSVSKWYLLGVK